MAASKSVRMFVQWKEQRRPINIKINDDLPTIEKAIINTYQLKKVNSLEGQQIQYYDRISKHFIDLYSETFDCFKQTLQLLSSEPPSRSTKSWTLNVVSKAIEIIRNRLPGSITDDTYSYQQENESTEFLQNQGTLPTQPTLVSSRSKCDNSEDAPDVQSSQNTDEEPQETDESHDPLLEFKTVNHEAIITSEHPYGLAFDRPLADHQRQQFESDVVRGKSTKQKKTLGGVLLKSSHQLDATSTNNTTYPAVHFQIPPDKLHLDWFLHAYILTEADTDGKYYIHASKSIFNNCTKTKDKLGSIPDTQLVNPHEIKLSQDDIRDGRYEFRLKVCNVRNLCTHKRKQLQEFPRLNGSIDHDDPSLLSSKTSCDLKFASERYHLGCILVCDKTVDDRCISTLTVAESSRKRNDSAKRTQPEDDVKQTQPEDGVKRTQPEDGNEEKSKRQKQNEDNS